MRIRQQGFTLIELMIVIAIVAILAAIALPLYLNYTARAEGAEALTLSSGLKPDVVEFYNEYGRFPGNPANASIGAAQPQSLTGKYVERVELVYGGSGNGAIKATYGKEVSKVLAGKYIILSPITHGGSIAWTCRTDAPFRLVPAICRNSG